MTALFSFFLDTVAPRECFSCGARGAWLCRRCADSIPLLAPPACPVCGKTPLPGGRLQDECQGHLGLDRLILSATLHHRFIQLLLYGMKYHGLRSAAGILARLCVRALHEQFALYPSMRSRAACVPIPLFKQKENYRGFNQASLIAREIANSCHIAYAELLECRRPMRDQIGLTKSERRINLHGAFTAVGRPDDEIDTLLLIDDVVTTGATMRSAAENLRAATERPLTIIGVAAAYNN